jgi:diguanylate cyclase (GGDEF)-like protein/PAS domain S-box-containing protein
MAIATDAQKQGRAASLSLLARVRDALPRGQLPYEAWRTRHRAVLVLLWGHVVAIFIFGIVAGYGPLHVTLESGIVAFAAVWATSPRASRTIRTLAACFGLIAASAVLTHFSGGYIEVHFHFFIMLSVIALYQEWLPFLMSVGFVAAHHTIVGVLDPQSVFNHPDAVAHPFKWAMIHAGFISFACAVYVVGWRFTQSASRLTDAVLLSTGEGIMGIDATGRVAFMNPAAESLTGYSAGELDLAKLRRALTFSNQGELPAPLGPATPQSDVQLLTEGMVSKRDGAAVPAEFLVSYMPDRGLLVITFRDITERRSAEQSIRSSEEKFSKAFHRSPLGVTITSTDTQRFIDVNDAFTRLVGYDRDEAIGRTSTDLNLWASVENRQEMIDGLAKDGAVRELPTQFRTKSGQILDCVLTAEMLDLDEGPCVLTLVQDITARVQAEQTIRASEERFRALIEKGSDIILVLSVAGVVEYLSPSAATVMGYSPEEIMGTSAFPLIHPDDRQETLLSFSRTVQGTNQPVSIEFRALHQDGTWRVMEAMSDRIVESSGATSVVVNCREITQRKEAEETIRHLAYHDALTGLPNRALLGDRLTVALAKARRSSETLALIFIDLDEFKLVNDTLGHSVGDELLRGAATRLTLLLREGDTVSRVGGDEFIVLLSDVDRPEHALQIAERMRESLKEPYNIVNMELRVTTSIGISIYPDDGDDEATLLRNADTAMYRAKDAGRDNCQLYTSSMGDELRLRVTLETELRRAIEHEQLIVYYQPIVELNSGEIIGCEALVRWQHPERGLILPGEFIEVAERTGLITPLSEWVLHKASEDNQAWQDSGLRPIPVAVNVSSRRFQHIGFGEITRRTLADTGLDPHCLHLEITEGTIMEDVVRGAAILKGLRDSGIRISIDDFGTGYSSLSYLRTLPIDAVKIDRSFVSGIGLHNEDGAVITAIIALAESLHLEVIAEGIETVEQLDFLRDHGCLQGQGFLFARPMPAADFRALMQSTRTLVAPASAYRSRWAVNSSESS